MAEALAVIVTDAALLLTFAVLVVMPVGLVLEPAPVPADVVYHVMLGVLPFAIPAVAMPTEPELVPEPPPATTDRLVEFAVTDLASNEWLTARLVTALAGMEKLNKYVSPSPITCPAVTVFVAVAGVMPLGPDRLMVCVPAAAAVPLRVTVTVTGVLAATCVVPGTKPAGIEIAAVAVTLFLTTLLPPLANEMVLPATAVTLTLTTTGFVCTPSVTVTVMEVGPSETPVTVTVEPEAAAVATVGLLLTAENIRGVFPPVALAVNVAVWFTVTVDIVSVVFSRSAQVEKVNVIGFDVYGPGKLLESVAVTVTVHVGSTVFAVMSSTSDPTPIILAVQLDVEVILKLLCDKGS